MSSRLRCRKCKGKGKITKQTLYRYKKIVTISCTNCENIWHLSVPRDWEPSWEERKVVLPAETESIKAEERSKTAMELAFEKARKATKEFPY